LPRNIDFIWTEKCDITFANLKRIVSTAPVLQGLNGDIPFRISSDVSDKPIGVALGQEEDNKP